MMTRADVLDVFEDWQNSGKEELFEDIESEAVHSEDLYQSEEKSTRSLRGLL